MSKELQGENIAYFNYPYSKVQYFSVQTAGMMDVDRELILAFNDGNTLSLDFKSSVDIRHICTLIAEYVL